MALIAAARIPTFWPVSLAACGAPAPPSSQEPVVPPTKAGLVDIYFASQASNDPRLSAFLRWRTQAKAQGEEAAPGKGRLDIKGVPTEGENVYRKTPVELAEYFDGEDVRLWIFDPARDHHNNEHGVKLTFSGAFLFNQFNIQHQFRELVLPLTRECRYVRRFSRCFSIAGEIAVSDVAPRVDALLARPGKGQSVGSIFAE